MAPIGPKAGCKEKIVRLLLAGGGAVSTVCLVLLCVSVLFSRTNPTPANPTVEADAIRTAAVETVLAAQPILTDTARATPSTAVAPAATATLTDVEIPLPGFPDLSGISGAACVQGRAAQHAKVTQVIDGDTIRVLLDEDDKTYTLHYIGIDAPEMNTAENYSGEANAKNAELVYGKAAELIKDVSETDKYGRLLRYVIVDKIFVNYALVDGGYAKTASYAPDTACIPTFQGAELGAEAAKRGLWTVPPTAAEAPTLAPLPTQASRANCDPAYPDVCLQDGIGDYDCAGGSGNGPNYVRGPFTVQPPDPFGLDRDGDGVGCE